MPTYDFRFFRVVRGSHLRFLCALSVPTLTLVATDTHQHKTHIFFSAPGSYDASSSLSESLSRPLEDSYAAVYLLLSKHSATTSLLAEFHRFAQFFEREAVFNRRTFKNEAKNTMFSGKIGEACQASSGRVAAVFSQSNEGLRRRASESNRLKLIYQGLCKDLAVSNHYSFIALNYWSQFGGVILGVTCLCRFRFRGASRARQ
jgi:hypothetical protein